ncbi:hypothetical protein DP116_06810 [Brasilonema bromeliae SPC951]|uniref:Uncharacterized protein n=1 Tax=Brasilonema bromeliae SPC951 TaxID=385972 RepID=A0ABX1P579_9CYAN|nr:hypothetical protein [Brasilonema bromeliae SPC951]
MLEVDFGLRSAPFNLRQIEFRTPLTVMCIKTSKHKLILTNERQVLMGETTPGASTGGTPATHWLPKTALPPND